MIEITYAGVWRTLDAVDLSEYHQQIDTGRTDKKGKPIMFTYVSWTDAWKVLMEYYPYAEYEFLPETYENNNTVMTHCNLKIGKLTRYMWLPVMNFRNQSVVNPTTREIQDARMRCLVKAISMYGLGAYLFRGEDLPSAEKDKEELAVKMEKKTSKSPMYIFKNLDEEILVEEEGTVKYLKGLAEVLPPENPGSDEIALYEANKNTIAAAYKSTNVKKYKEAYERLIDTYEQS
tara:strand:- start:517 stop:1215 length:699 start_codon:yes stop_codon:yes gene_type:complete